jgi:hypothetical protein
MRAVDAAVLRRQLHWTLHVAHFDAMASRAHRLPALEYCDGKSKYLARPLAFSYG